jgi:transcriptional regulator with XRE-family HTH domain
LQARDEEAAAMLSLDGDEDHPAKRLGRKLKEARIAAGYRSQEEFSESLVVHRTSVTKIEGGARHVTPEILKKWCELCHVDYELYQAAARLARVAEASPLPVWFQDFFRAQTLAHTIRTGLHQHQRPHEVRELWLIDAVLGELEDVLPQFVQLILAP